MKKATKWTPSEPTKRQDCIISSKARENNEVGFLPSYEKEKTENMYFIMSNEYLRIWLKERGRYEIDTYSKLEVEGTGGSDIKRRYVQRYMRPKADRVKVLPPMQMKRFTKATVKVDSRREKDEKSKNK